MDGRRSSLGTAGGLHVSFQEDDEDTDPPAVREAISPGWLAVDGLELDSRKRENRKHQSPRKPDLTARARAVHTRVGIRETDSARFARASPRQPWRASSPRSSRSSPRSPRAASPRASVTPLASVHAHGSRPWISQHGVEKTADDLWKRSSAAEYVQSLNSLAESLNHPKPLVRATTRRSIESIVQRERTEVTSSVSGRLSAAEFVKKLRDGKSPPRRDARSGASRPWRESRAPAPAPAPAPASPEPEPFRTPSRETAGPVTAKTASSFSEWYSANESGHGTASPASSYPPSMTSPAVPEPEPEPELQLLPASPSPSRSPLRPMQFDRSYSPSRNYTGAQPAASTSPPPPPQPPEKKKKASYQQSSRYQGRVGGGAAPAASPRTVERRERVAALALAARGR